MKLPIIKGMLIVAAVLQAPLAFSQGRPGPGGGRPGGMGSICAPGQTPAQNPACVDTQARPPKYPGDNNNGPVRPGGPNQPGGPDWDRPGRPGYGGGHPGHNGPGRPHRPDPTPWNPNPWNPPRPTLPRPPVPPPNYYGEETVEFVNITRRSGGEWLRVGFYGSSYVDRVSLEITRAGLKVHEAYAITTSGRRINLRELTYGGVMYAYDSITSNYISAGERISAIDIRAESYGDFARMRVTVQSSSGRPAIVAQRP